MGTALWPGGSDLAACTWELKPSCLPPIQVAIRLMKQTAGYGGNLPNRFPDQPIPPACFAVTVELRGNLGYGSGTGKARMQLIFFHFSSTVRVLPARHQKSPPLAGKATPLTGVDYIKAEKPGIISYLKEVGTFVTRGETIAIIVNPLARAVKATGLMRSGVVTDGTFFQQKRRPLCPAGKDYRQRSPELNPFGKPAATCLPFSQTWRYLLPSKTK